MSHQRIDSFLAELAGYVERNDRGALADLRRGLSPATEERAWPYLASYCDLRNHEHRLIWQTVAAGFATIERSTESGNLGRTLRALAMGDRRGAEGVDALKSFDARFRRLLTCRSSGDLCRHLPAIIRAAKCKGVEIDFRRLFWDLMQWDGENRDDVRARWAAAYWGTPEEMPA